MRLAFLAAAGPLCWTHTSLLLVQRQGVEPRRAVRAASAASQAPAARRSEPYGFGGGGAVELPTARPDSGQRRQPEGAAGSSEQAEARAEALEARLKRKLEAGERAAGGSSGGHSERSPCASSSGRRPAQGATAAAGAGTRADRTPSASSSGRGAAQGQAPASGVPQGQARPAARAGAPRAVAGVGQAKAARNASAKGGPARQKAPAPAPVRSPSDGLSKRQERRVRKGVASGAPTERLAKVGAACAPHLPPHPRRGSGAWAPGSADQLHMSDAGVRQRTAYALPSGCCSPGALGIVWVWPSF